MRVVAAVCPPSYSVCVCGIFAAPESGYRHPADLAGVPVGVGYHSGSHYSAIQALEEFLDRDQIELSFIGLPYDRVRLLLTGLRRAQRDIDFEPERYKHYWTREMPEDIQRLVDVRRFGPGERIVSEPYTRSMFEQSQRWMQAWDLFDPDAAPRPAYENAVLT